jgi:predicted house-cleaning noncanonical NTP pyrophosphatase (MazG superfamily)
MTKFPYVERALQNNARFRDIIAANELNEEYLERLFRELFENSCEGIENKVAEARPDLLGLLSLLSEFEFARYFIRKKMKVKLLSCNDFGGRSPPDIWVCGDPKEFWVEVKNISEDRVIFFLGRKIASILNSQRLSFAIMIGSSNLMSIPTYSHATRKEKEKLVQPIIDEFMEKIKDLSSKSPPITIRTTNIDVELLKTKFKRSYMGGTTMKQAICEPKEYTERIRFDVLQKAKKRNKWLGEELDKPYIVAFDSESMFFYLDRFNAELFGNATIYGGDRIPETRMSQEIEEAVNNGWKEYLEKMRILRVDRTVIPEDKRGLFLTDPTTKNVSAVLLMHQQTFYILANPFADRRINHPTILQDFADCHSGWE